MVNQTLSFDTLCCEKEPSKCVSYLDLRNELFDLPNSRNQMRGIAYYSTFRHYLIDICELSWQDRAQLGNMRATLRTASCK